MKTGIELIAEEREDQLIEHGRSIAQDVRQNRSGQLTQAATALISESETDSEEVEMMMGLMPGTWTNAVCLKMCRKSYKARLIIAGALIAAEIDRLQAE